LLQKSKRKEYKQKYIRQVNVKVNRSRKQRKTWQEVYQECIDNTYGPGIAIAAIDRDSSVPKKKRRTASSKKSKWMKKHTYYLKRYLIAMPTLR